MALTKFLEGVGNTVTKTFSFGKKSLKVAWYGERYVAAEEDRGARNANAEADRKLKEQLAKKEQDFRLALENHKTEQARNLAIEMAYLSHQFRLQEQKENFKHHVEQAYLKHHLDHAWPLRCTPPEISSLLSDNPNHIPVFLVFTDPPKSIKGIVQSALSRTEDDINDFVNTTGKTRFLNFLGGWKEAADNAQGEAFSKILHQSLKGYPTLLFRAEYHEDDERLVIKADFWGLGLAEHMISSKIAEFTFAGKDAGKEEKQEMIKNLNALFTSCAAATSDIYHFLEYNLPPETTKHLVWKKGLSQRFLAAGQDNSLQATYLAWKQLHDGQTQLFFEEGLRYLADCEEMEEHREWVEREREKFLPNWLDQLGVPMTAGEIADPSPDAQWLFACRTPDNREIFKKLLPLAGQESERDPRIVALQDVLERPAVFVLHPRRAADLQKYIDKTPPGETIQLGPGTYQCGSLRIDKAINIVGATNDPTDVVLLMKSSCQRPMNMEIADSPTVSNLTVLGYRHTETIKTILNPFTYESKSDVIVSNGAPRITNCLFRDINLKLSGIAKGTFDSCEVTDSVIVLQENSDPTMRRCIVKNAGNGITIRYHAKGTFEDCQIAECGTGFALWGHANPTVRSCVIRECGTGVDFNKSANGKFENCKIFGNKEKNINLEDSKYPSSRRSGFTNCTDDKGNPISW